MRILALETDVGQITAKYLTGGEREVLLAYHHWLVFCMGTLWQSMILVVTGVIAFVAASLGMSPMWAAGIVGLALLLWILPRTFTSYIDWRYDVLFVTTDKIVLIDQSSIIRQRVTEMSLDNIASVTAETQWFNLFPFGCVRFNLKEGIGGEIILTYIPNAEQVAARISDAMTEFQRRKNGGA